MVRACALLAKVLWASDAGESCVYKVEQRHNAGSYASDYLPTWAGLAASPEAAFAGVCEMHSAGEHATLPCQRSSDQCILIKHCSEALMAAL